MKHAIKLTAATLLLLVTSVAAFADDASTKDAELKMLRSTVKTQNDVLEPLRAKVKSQTAEIQRLTDEVTTLKKDAQDAGALNQQLGAITKELDDVKQTLAARENQLSEASAKLRAKGVPTTGPIASIPAVATGDPVKDEFAASFQKFAADLEREFRLSFEKIYNDKAHGFEGKIQNFSVDVVMTPSAIAPLVGVAKATCYQSQSVNEKEYGLLRVESFAITMKFTRADGIWKLTDATHQVTQVTGSDTTGKSYDKDGGTETDYSQSLVVRAAVGAAHGILPPKVKGQ